MLPKGLFLLLVWCSTVGGSVRDRKFWIARDSRCPTNMEYQRCGSLCGPLTLTCKEYFEGKKAPDPDKCKRRCGLPKCECPSGMVKDPDNYCVPPDECPSIPNTPVDISKIPPALAAKLLAGIAKRKKGATTTTTTTTTTIPIVQVKPENDTCPPTMVMNGCTSYCAPAYSNCETFHKYQTDNEYREKMSHTVCITTCGPPRCECPSDQVQGPDKLCIPPEQCPIIIEKITEKPPSVVKPEPDKIEEKPTPVCPYNMVWRDCATRCEQTCEAYHQQQSCSLGCAPPRCQCPGGQVQGPSGPCIPTDQCPPPVKFRVLYKG